MHLIESFKIFYGYICKKLFFTNITIKFINMNNFKHPGTLFSHLETITLEPSDCVEDFTTQTILPSFRFVKPLTEQHLSIPQRPIDEAYKVRINEINDQEERKYADIFDINSGEWFSMDNQNKIINFLQKYGGRVDASEDTKPVSNLFPIKLQEGKNSCYFVFFVDYWVDRGMEMSFMRGTIDSFDDQTLLKIKDKPLRIFTPVCED